MKILSNESLNQLDLYSADTPGQVINLEFSAKNESHQPVLKFIVRLIKVRKVQTVSYLYKTNIMLLSENHVLQIFE